MRPGALRAVPGGEGGAEHRPLVRVPRLVAVAGGAVQVAVEPPLPTVVPALAYPPCMEAQLTVRSRCRSQSPWWARPQATAAALTGRWPRRARVSTVGPTVTAAVAARRLRQATPLRWAGRSAWSSCCCRYWFMPAASAPGRLRRPASPLAERADSLTVVRSVPPRHELREGSPPIRLVAGESGSPSPPRGAAAQRTARPSRPARPPAAGARGSPPTAHAHGAGLGRGSNTSRRPIRAPRSARLVSSRMSAPSAAEEGPDPIGRTRWRVIRVFQGFGEAIGFHVSVHPSLRSRPLRSQSRPCSGLARKGRRRRPGRWRQPPPSASPGPAQDLDQARRRASR